MDSTALYNQFRLDVRDAVEPYLWSPEEVYYYMDEAQKEFCRLTGGIADATSTECARVDVTTGEAFAPVSPKVLKIRAVFDEDGKRLDLVNFEDLEAAPSEGLDLFASVAGTVTTVVLGMEPNQIKLVNTPEEDQTLNLIVYRLPLTTIDDADQALEIDAQHHSALLLWMRHLAHLKSDAEAYDRGRADQYARDFQLYCRLATDEKARREHKYRTVQFSW